MTATKLQLRWEAENQQMIFAEIKMFLISHIIYSFSTIQGSKKIYQKYFSLSKV